MTKTTGSVALTKYKRFGEVAKALGVERCTVSAWASGSIRPKTYYRLALYELISIHPVKWLTKAEIRSLEKLTALS